MIATTVGKDTVEIIILYKIVVSVSQSSRKFIGVFFFYIVHLLIFLFSLLHLMSGWANILGKGTPKAEDLYDLFAHFLLVIHRSRFLMMVCNPPCADNWWEWSIEWKNKYWTPIPEEGKIIIDRPISPSQPLLFSSLCRHELKYPIPHNPWKPKGLIGSMFKDFFLFVCFLPFWFTMVPPMLHY